MSRLNIKNCLHICWWWSLWILKKKETIVFISLSSHSFVGAALVTALPASIHCFNNQNIPQSALSPKTVTLPTTCFQAKIRQGLQHMTNTQRSAISCKAMYSIITRKLDPKHMFAGVNIENGCYLLRCAQNLCTPY